MKKLLQNSLLVLFSTSIALLLLEGLAQIYVYQVAKQGKLFEPDSTLGWKVLPNLELERLNADDEVWKISTNAAGWRSVDSFRDDAATRVLVLGDSFAFGEGVSIEERFDSLLGRDRRNWSFVNLGVQGYGTDQQMIQLRGRAHELRAGDVLIILTYGNDFFDILREHHAGRAKPRFELLESGELLEHFPEISWGVALRDRSYLLARLMSGFQAPSDFGPADLARAGRLYRAMFERIVVSVLKPGVRILVAYHGLGYVSDPRARHEISNSIESVCRMRRVECLDLDPPLRLSGGEANFLRDRHWNPGGHRVAAQAIGAWLSRPGPGS